MTSVRRRRKVKNSASKVRRNKKSTGVKKTLVLDPILATHWDREKTLEENYRQAGLANHINQDIGKRETQHNLAEWNWKRKEMLARGEVSDLFNSEDEIFQELATVFAKPITANQSSAAAPGDVSKAVDIIERFAKEATQIEDKRERPLSEFERSYITKLIQKHGDNFDRMFMDIKLNDRQLTIHQLKKLALRL